MDYLVIGCGLSGAVISRYLADRGNHVTIWERRNHIGGNLYDYVDGHGFLVHKYGPHTFHTYKKEIFEYICKYEQWKPYRVTCGAVWDGKYTPTPFNFTTIDTFYPPDKADMLKQKLLDAFEGQSTATVVDVLQNPDSEIRAYAEYLFQKDYAPYTAKQWGISAAEIDPSVLKRVPLRFSYVDGYFDDPYQVIPAHSYNAFFENLLHHHNIKLEMETDALEHLRAKDGMLFMDGVPFKKPVVYTGALDELFGCVHGNLPYRSLRFDWKFSDEESFQQAPVVAYPQEDGYTRITEYKKLLMQDKLGTSYAVEYPLPYNQGTQAEPYYPILTAESQKQYEQYSRMADQIPNLIYCGRLADFQYYNMDQALERALCCAAKII